jgi:hypothetical protein
LWHCFHIVSKGNYLKMFSFRYTNMYTFSISLSFTVKNFFWALFRIKTALKIGRCFGWFHCWSFRHWHQWAGIREADFRAMNISCDYFNR